MTVIVRKFQIYGLNCQERFLLTHNITHPSKSGQKGLVSMFIPDYYFSPYKERSYIQIYTDYKYMYISSDYKFHQDQY